MSTVSVIAGATVRHFLLAGYHTGKVASSATEGSGQVDVGR